MTMNKVLHLSKTPIAGSPGIISRMINLYSSWTSIIHVTRKTLSAGDFSIDYQQSIEENMLKDNIEDADIIHFHNSGPREWSLKAGKPFVIQLHSEPKVMNRLAKEYPNNCVTIAQKHAILYQTLPAVPNLIPVFDEMYCRNGSGDENIIHIVYAPTSRAEPLSYENTCQGKGYLKTLDVLSRIKNYYLEKVRISILTQKSKEEILRAKGTADIVIDECVTGGYHLSSLEALSLGAVTIANLMPEVKQLIYKITGSNSDNLPWVNCSIEKLDETLEKLIELKLNNPKAFAELKRKGRLWMEEYWNPATLVKHYTSLYNRTLRRTDDAWAGLNLSSNVKNIERFRKSACVGYDNYQKELEVNTDTLKHKHRNEPALIMGHGPSIKKINLDNFIAEKKPLLFNCNYYYNQFKNVPDYWFCIDSTALEAREWVPKDRILIINPPNQYKPMPFKRVWIERARDSFLIFFNYSFELQRPCTAATIMTLYAMYMGCNPIYIAGVDLSRKKGAENYCYSDKAGSFYNNKFRPFDANYEHIIREFKLMKVEAERLGIKIYNLDPSPKNFNVFEVFK
jgi:hypothetical protein